MPRKTAFSAVASAVAAARFNEAAARCRGKPSAIARPANDPAIPLQ